MIPKITHQIWMQGFENIPEKFKKNVEALHALNPEYEHRQWNESLLREECEKYSSECLERFDSFELMTLKIDLGRYVVLYNYGGISVDTDMEQLKPLSTLSYSELNGFTISKTAFPLKLFGFLNNAVIITPPQNNILKNIIDRIIADNRSVSDFSSNNSMVDETTGPRFINNTLSSINIPYTILDNKYFEPCSSLDYFCRVHKDSIMNHHHEGSWRSWYNILSEVLLILFLRSLPFFIICFIFVYIYRNKFQFFKKRR